MLEGNVMPCPHMLAMGEITCTDEESGLDHTSDMSNQHEKIGKPNENL